MKKAVVSLFALLLIGIVLTGVGAGLAEKEGLLQPGIEVEYTPTSYQSAPFEKVVLQFNSARTLIWRESDTYRVDWYDSNLTSVTVQVEEGVLIAKESSRSVLQVGKIKGERATDFVITLPADVRLDVDVNVKGYFSGNFASREGDWGEVKLDVDGVAALQMDGSVDFLSATVDGACEADISGNAESVMLKVNGMLQLEANDWTCTRLTCSVDGATDLKLSGSGDDVQLDTNGVCSMTADDFQVNELEVDVSGIATLRA